MGNTLKENLAPFATPGFYAVWSDAIWAIDTLNLNATYPHYWHRRVRASHKLHPLIAKLIVEYAVKPVDWHLMLLEWPHISKTEPDKIAYTRNEENGHDFIYNHDKRQTKTTVGKYLARHYPHIPDHLKRDIAALYNAPDYKIWRTKEEIICGIELGPQSCMKSSYGSVPFSSNDNDRLMAWYNGDRSVDVRWDRHPYAVYKPEYGWGMAVQIDKGRPDIVLSRALVYQDPANEKRRGFVRSYVARGDWSESDHTLEAWLKEQGYSHWSCWPEGAMLAYVKHPKSDGPMLPYIDGGTQTVSNQGGYFAIDCDGDLTCDNTDGTVAEDEAIGECEECQETIYEGDEYTHVGRDEGTLVCQCCCDNHYSFVLGGSRWGNRSYYVHENNAIEIDGDYYDEQNLPDCIVTRADGEYAHIDNVVRCVTDDEYYDSDDEDIVEIDNAWYRTDDDDVVECADGEYRLKVDCWQDPYSEDWYSDDEDGVDVEEGKYHPDSLRKMADNA